MESRRADAFRLVQNSERLRKFLIYGGVAAVFLLGMLAEYALTRL
jgi:hypothetical protein